MMTYKVTKICTFLVQFRYGWCCYTVCSEVDVLDKGVLVVGMAGDVDEIVA